jgi:hypothetical protein
VLKSHDLRIRTMMDDVLLDIRDLRRFKEIFHSPRSTCNTSIVSKHTQVRILLVHENLRPILKLYYLFFL